VREGERRAGTLGSAMHLSQGAAMHLQGLPSHGDPGLGGAHSGLGGDPVVRWLAACRCVGGRWSVRLELRGDRPQPCDDLDLSRDEQQRLLALWARRDRAGHFERLGLAPTHDDAAIRRAYLETCRRLHPDRYYGKRIGGFAAILAELFDRARSSAEFLADPRRRARYLVELAAAAG
jgi:hypothetical protein